jgi:hypothetical protein
MSDAAKIIQPDNEKPCVCMGRGSIPKTFLKWVGIDRAMNPRAKKVDPHKATTDSVFMFGFPVAE